MVTDFGNIALGKYNFVNAAKKADAAYGTTKINSTITSPFGPQEAPKSDAATTVKISEGVQQEGAKRDIQAAAMERGVNPQPAVVTERFAQFKAMHQKSVANGDLSASEPDSGKAMLNKVLSFGQPPAAPSLAKASGY